MGPNFLSLLAHKTDTIISVTTPKPNSISVPECAFTLGHRSLNRFTSDWTNFSLASKQCHPRRNRRIVAFQPNVQPLDFSQAWDWVPLKHGGNVSGELHALKPCKSRVDRKNSLQIQIMTLTAFPRPFAASSRSPILPSRTFLCHQEKTQTMTGNDDVNGEWVGKRTGSPRGADGDSFRDSNRPQHGTQCTVCPTFQGERWPKMLAPYFA